MSYVSHHGQVLLALRDRIKDLSPDGVGDEEVQVRDHWLGPNNEPYRGITLYDGGESSRDGTIGTQDVGYVCGVCFCKHREGDATLASDRLMQWRELIRRELDGSRLSVTIVDATDPLEHVCIVSEAGRNLSSGKYPSYWIKHLTITVWLREIGTG